MLLGWTVLFGHCICSKNSLGRVHACCHARQSFKHRCKAPSEAKASAPSRAEQPGRQRGGRRAGRCSTRHISTSSRDSLLEEGTAFGLIYISATSSTAAYVDPCQGVRFSKLSTAMVFPCSSRGLWAQAGQGAAPLPVGWELVGIGMWAQNGTKWLQHKCMSLLVPSDCRQLD